MVRPDKNPNTWGGNATKKNGFHIPVPKTRPTVWTITLAIAIDSFCWVESAL